jgi:hypothetical protein
MTEEERAAAIVAKMMPEIMALSDEEYKSFRLHLEDAISNHPQCQIEPLEGTRLHDLIQRLRIVAEIEALEP